MPYTSRSRPDYIDRPAGARPAHRFDTIDPAAAAPAQPLRPHGQLDTASIDQIVGVLPKTWPDDRPRRRSRRDQGVRLVLGHLAGFGGDSWQRPWVAAGLNERGRPVHDLPGSAGWQEAGTAGFGAQIDELTAEITALLEALAPSLLAIPGRGALTAATILGQTAGVDRFTSKDAYARHNGTAPLPVWSANRARHRLSRTGNRQLNAALHRIALTQAHWHHDAKAMITRRKAAGDSGREAIRILKRRPSEVVYRVLQADLTNTITGPTA